MDLLDRSARVLPPVTVITAMISPRKLLFLIALSLVGAAETGADLRRLAGGTGGVAGIYHPVGNAICRRVNDRGAADGFACSVRTTSGSMQNLEALRAGKLEFGIARSDREHEALVGSNAFAASGPFLGLRSVFSLHAESLTVISRRLSAIRTLDDFEGRRIDAGGKGSTAQTLLLDLLDVTDVGHERLLFDHSIDRSLRAHALCNGDSDALVVMGAHPITLVTEVSNRCATTFTRIAGTDIERLLASNAAYRRATIPSGLYRGLDDDIETFGYGAVVVTSTAVDNASVKLLVQAVLDDLEAFKRLHPVFALLDAREMITEGMSSPPHDGVLQYLREAGLP